MLASIIGNSFPQKSEHDEIAMPAFYTCSTQLNDLAAQGFKWIKFEFLSGIIAAICRGVDAGLQPVSPHDLAAGQMFHDQVVADFVEGILVETGEIRFLKAFVQFEIEDF